MYYIYVLSLLLFILTIQTLENSDWTSPLLNTTKLIFFLWQPQLAMWHLFLRHYFITSLEFLKPHVLGRVDWHCCHTATQWHKKAKSGKLNSGYSGVPLNQTKAILSIKLYWQNTVRHFVFSSLEDCIWQLLALQ